MMTANNDAAKPSRPWNEVVAEKRAIREAQLARHAPAANGDSGSATLGADLVEIEALTSLLESGQASAEDLTRAYIAR